MKKSNEYEKLIAQCEAYVAEKKPSCNNPAMAARVVAPLVFGKAQEAFYMLPLDAMHKLIKAPIMVTLGVGNSAPVGVKEVFRYAILSGAESIIVAHNHPSGDVHPSSADVETTRTLVDAGKLIGIKVLDHVIIGNKTEQDGNWFYSMREAGII